ncbi:hypothetical protein D3C72_1712020 [compost metagenome]|jgi:hypothetical protein
MADGADGRAADLARPFGNVVGHRKDLRALFVQQRVIITEMRTGNMPVEILGLDVEREDIRQQRGQRSGDVAARFSAKVGRRCEWKLAVFGGCGRVHDRSPFAIDRPLLSAPVAAV